MIMSDLSYVLIYFSYGLAFFSMGLVVTLEGGRASDERLRRGLRPLAAFGLVHALHEWIEMLGPLAPYLHINLDTPIYYGIRLAILTFSFLSLSAFGSYLLAHGETAMRVSLLVPIGLVTLWVFGLFNIRGAYPLDDIWALANVWTRYSLAIPAALLAAVGLIYQQRAFRRSGLIRFGQDALWAAIAFGWYGLVGQLFSPKTPIWPSTVLNEQLFDSTFGFPIQLFRAMTAIAASIFVIRFLRAFQVEVDSQIASLQAARLKEAQEREALRGELFRQVVAAQESERQRIARDLHDEMGQSLTAIGLGLRGLSTTIRNGRVDQATSTLRHLENLAANSLTELQHLIADLRPSHLDDLGLPATLRWYAGAIQERTDLEVKVETTGPEQEISGPIKIALFRIVQESLNNIIKHANASQVGIQINFEMENLRLRVRDNGRGFDVQAVRNNKLGRVSLGLIGMQERAGLLGGTCAVTSVPGRGTLVEVKVPYHNQEEKLNENPTAVG
jgi:signal transduction histidine kinase